MLYSKGGIFIDNKIIKLKSLVEGEDKKIIIQIFNEVSHLKIKDIEYEKNLELSNISGYEFELVKVNAKLENEEDIDIYLKMIKNTKIKESIFCYWCAIYEEELLKVRENENMDTFLNKVLISELNKSKYQKRIFLTIENNQTQILETGTEVNFIEIIDYINELKNEENQLEKLYKYFDKESEDVLLVGVKLNK